MKSNFFLATIAFSVGTWAVPAFSQTENSPGQGSLPGSAIQFVLPNLESTCLWAGRLYSLESIFCWSKAVALRCVAIKASPAQWVQEETPLCEGATPVDTK